MKSPPIPLIVILEKLQKAKTSKQVDKIIKSAWDRDSQEFFLGLQYSMDSSYVFNLQKAPKYDDDSDDGSNNFTFDDFYELVTWIKKSKNISIEEIKLKVKNAASNCNPYLWNNFYRLILLKKLHTSLPIDFIIQSLKNLANPNNCFINKQQTAKLHDE